MGATRDLTAEMIQVYEGSTVNRADRQTLVGDGLGGMTSQWVVDARADLLTAVNVVRSEQNLPDANIAEILLLEIDACGSFDYVERLAGGCARLALGV